MEIHAAGKQKHVTTIYLVSKLANIAALVACWDWWDLDGAFQWTFKLHLFLIGFCKN